MKVRFSKIIYFIKYQNRRTISKYQSKSIIAGFFSMRCQGHHANLLQVLFFNYKLSKMKNVQLMAKNLQEKKTN